jgi:hypothetical protein
LTDTVHNQQKVSLRLQQLGALCRADVSIIGGWFKEGSKGSIRLCALTIIICGGLYGFTLGYWRAPEMGLYVAVKVPLLMFLVLLSNGLINGMFASLLGSGLTFRQTLTMSLISFTTVTLILGALSPITFFMVLNAPAPGTPGAESWHSLTLVIHTALIAYAGVVGNYKAYLLLCGITEDPSTAKRTFLAWLIVNLFVGAQLSYILRPFFGNPTLDVAFLRDNAFQGSFYEVLFHHFTALFQ